MGKIMIVSQIFRNTRLKIMVGMRSICEIMLETSHGVMVSVQFIIYILLFSNIIVITSKLALALYALV
jgi:hypothetical protein